MIISEVMTRKSGSLARGYPRVRGPAHEERTAAACPWPRTTGWWGCLTDRDITIRAVARGWRLGTARSAT